MEGGKVLVKLQELPLEGVCFCCYPPTVSSIVNTTAGASLLLVVIENISGYVIHSVLEITGDDPHCSYVNYSRDATGTESFLFPKNNLQVIYLKSVINVCWDSRWVLERPFKSAVYVNCVWTTLYGKKEKNQANQQKTYKIKR